MQLSWVKIPRSDPEHQEAPVRPPGTDGKHSRGQKQLRFNWLSRLVAPQAEAEYRDYHARISNAPLHGLAPMISGGVRYGTWRKKLDTSSHYGEDESGWHDKNKEGNS